MASNNCSWTFSSLTVASIIEITEAGVEVLMARVEDNPFSEWAALAAELVRAAMGCHGTYITLLISVLAH
jgi:hypothetical protein